MKRPYATILLGVFILLALAIPAGAVSKCSWLLTKAQEGNLAAQYQVAECYEAGKGGMKKSRPKALYWYQKAASKGYAPALVEMGFRYQTGKGMHRRDINMGKAIGYYEAAAERGSAEAQLRLGVLYDEGTQVPEDNELAVSWYQKAAAQGDEMAIYNLSLNYWHGEGVAQDYEKAWTMLNQLRTTAKSEVTQTHARDALDAIKAELKIKTAEVPYPEWDLLKYYTQEAPP